MKQTVVQFNAGELKKVLLENLTKEQTRRLIEYAVKNIRLLGDAIQLYHGKHNMDRTGNLLDSLCWGVVYNGKMQACGFYRQQRASKESHLHEFYPDWAWLYPVYGHGEAELFLKKAAQQYGQRGWCVFFAILAPYWGYWESGFTIRRGRTTRHIQFQVMSQFFDKVRMELRPAVTHLSVHIEKYQSNKRKYKKRFIKNPSKTSERIRDSRAVEKRYFKNYYKKHAKFRKKR